MDRYPIKAPKKKPVPVYLNALVVQNAKGQFLLEKNESEKLLSGFWHFPLIEVDEFSKSQEELNLFNQVSEHHCNSVHHLKTVLSRIMI